MKVPLAKFKSFFFQSEGAERPVSELLEEEIIALKYGELQLAEQNTRLSKELSRVSNPLKISNKVQKIVSFTVTFTVNICQYVF